MDQERRLSHDPVPTHHCTARQQGDGARSIDFPASAQTSDLPVADTAGTGRAAVMAYLKKLIARIDLSHVRGPCCG